MALFSSKKNTSSDDDIKVYDITDEDYLNIGLDDDVPGSIGVPSTSGNKKNTRSPKDFIVFGVIIVVFLGYAMYSMMSGGDDTTGSGDSSEQTTAQSVAPSSESSVSNGIVVREENGMTYSGHDNGSQINGTGAILAFDYAYYTLRDGTEVIKNFNPKDNEKNSSNNQTEYVYSPQYVQSHIDKVPEDTTYDLDITPIETGSVYDVILTLHIPGSEDVQYSQRFSTMKVGDRYYVKEFDSQEILTKDKATSK